MRLPFIQKNKVRTILAKILTTIGNIKKINKSVWKTAKISLK